MLHPKTRSLNLVIVVQMLVYQLKKDHCYMFVRRFKYIILIFPVVSYSFDHKHKVRIVFLCFLLVIIFSSAIFRSTNAHVYFLMSGGLKKLGIEPSPLIRKDCTQQSSFCLFVYFFNEAFISITLIKAEKNIAEIISRFESFQLRSVVYWVYGITFLTDRSPGVEYEQYCVQIDPLRFRLAQGLVCCSRNIVELFNAHIVFRLQRLIKR